MQTETITAAQIHADFYGAEERLFVEAIGLTKNSVPNKGLVSRFQKIGFGNVKTVKEVAKLESKKSVSEKVISTIEYFRTYYPQYKFITESEVKILCEKYGLLLGDAANFTGDMPEKNLVDVENFKLRKEDWKEKASFGYFVPRASSVNEWGYFDSRREGSKSYIGESSFDMYMRQMQALLEPPRIQVQYSPGVDASKKKEVEKEQPPFKICAPKEDFNTLGYEVKDGYRLVWDPIVLQPVEKDGISAYLIVTCWGDEASDEMVVNQKMN